MSKNIQSSRLPRKHDGDDTTDNRVNKPRNSDSVIEFLETKKRLKPANTSEKNVMNCTVRDGSSINGYGTQKSPSHTNDNEGSDKHSLNGNSVSHHSGHSSDDSTHPSRPISVAQIVKSSKLSPSFGMGSTHSAARHKNTSPIPRSALRSREPTSSQAARDKVHRKNVTIVASGSKEKVRVPSGSSKRESLSPSRKQGGNKSSTDADNSTSQSSKNDRQDMIPPVLGSNSPADKDSNLIPIEVSVSAKTTSNTPNGESEEATHQSPSINAIKDNSSSTAAAEKSAVNGDALPEKASVVSDKANSMSNGASHNDEQLPSMKVSNGTGTVEEGKTKATVATDVLEKTEPNEEAGTEEDELFKKSPDSRFIRQNEEIGRGSFKTVYKGLDVETGVAVAWCELMVSIHLVDH